MLEASDFSDPDAVFVDEGVPKPQTLLALLCRPRKGQQQQGRGASFGEAMPAAWGILRLGEGTGALPAAGQ
jgi:hypothetical protein